MNRSGIVVLVFCACHATSGSPPAEPSVATVTGRVAVDAAAAPAITRGALFVTWLTEAEKPAFDEGKPSSRLLRDLLAR